MKVRIIWSRTTQELEENINNFLNILQAEQLVDIKYQVEDTSKYSAHFSCMIIYKEKTNKTLVE